MFVMEDTVTLQKELLKETCACIRKKYMLCIFISSTKDKKFYTTQDVPIYSSVCASTEMTFGINLGNVNDDKYHFDHRLGVIHQDKQLWYEDKYLRLVITSKNGLAKYLINDLISLNDDNTFTCEGRFTFYENTGITEKTFAQIIIKHMGCNK